MDNMDPKLLPRRVKIAALINANVYVFLGNMYASGIATGFESLEADFHVPYQKLSDILTWAVLAMGLCNLFWMPLAMCIGKRPAVLVSMVMSLGGFIWTSVAQSYGSLIAARIFASLGYGSIESLGPSILADIFHEHHYASAMASYALSLAGGSQIGPVIAGYLVGARGWRWFFILCIIIQAVNLVASLFMLPETLYELDDNSRPPSDGEKGTSNHFEAYIESQPSMDYNAYWRGLWNISLSKAARQRGPLKHFAYLFVLPLPMLLIPGVFLASIMYGVVLGAAPPYYFTSAQLGLFTLSSFIGIIVAFPIAGPLTDYLSRWMRKRNNDIHEPEHRLPTLIIPFLACPVGLIVFGYTVAHQEHYTRPAVGAALAASGLAMVPSVMLSYIVDSYPATSGEALVLVNASKNVVAFGLAKGISPHITPTNISIGHTNPLPMNETNGTKDHGRRKYRRRDMRCMSLTERNLIQQTGYSSCV
ncbi:hypothetical protein MW887_005932 [Aspergillus wentii]|nr:hypothetical protein MW887_005932 [Aspergillus wentii]